MLSIFSISSWFIWIIKCWMKIFCPVKFLRSIRMSLKLLLRCGVINVSPKVEFNEPNKRFRVEDKFAVLLGELPGHFKVPGHSRRNVSNCSISLGVSRAECIQFPVQGPALAATSRAMMAACHWLRGAAKRTNGRPGSGREEAVAWFLAAGTIWGMQRRGLARAGDSRPARPLKNGCKSSGGPTWDDCGVSRPASGLQQEREQYFGPPRGILK